MILKHHCVVTSFIVIPIVIRHAAWSFDFVLVGNKSKVVYLIIVENLRSLILVQMIQVKIERLDRIDGLDRLCNFSNFYLGWWLVGVGERVMLQRYLILQLFLHGLKSAILLDLLKLTRLGRRWRLLKRWIFESFNRFWLFQIYSEQALALLATIKIRMTSRVGQMLLDLDLLQRSGNEVGIRMLIVIVGRFTLCILLTVFETFLLYSICVLTAAFVKILLLKMCLLLFN